jgi:hypothetical protein
MKGPQGLRGGGRVRQGNILNLKPTLRAPLLPARRIVRHPPNPDQVAPGGTTRIERSYCRAWLLPIQLAVIPVDRGTDAVAKFNKNFWPRGKLGCLGLEKTGFGRQYFWDKIFEQEEAEVTEGGSSGAGWN